MSPLKTRAVLITCSFLLSLILLEIGARLAGIGLSSLQQIKNKRAMRTRGVCRILCLGESTTARQWPGPLEEALNQSGAGIKFSVIDEGIMGCNTDVIRSRLQQYIRAYRPDMVVVMAGINDRHVAYYAGIPQSSSWMFRHCRIYRFISIAATYAVRRLKKQDMPVKRAFTHSAAACGQQERVSAANIIEPDPLNAPQYVNLGFFCLSRGKFSRARAFFEKAIALDPQANSAYDGLGYLYNYEGRFDLCEAAFRQALELAPQDDNAYVGLGCMFRNQNKCVSAEEAFQKAVGLNPRNDEAYLELGYLYRAQGNLLPAEQPYKMIPRVDQSMRENDTPYLKLRFLCSDEDKVRQAEASWKKAVEINPVNKQAQLELGLLYSDRGMYREAAEELTKAMRLDPSNDIIYRALANVYRAAGDPAAAQAYAARVRVMESKGYAQVTVGNYRAIKEMLDARGIRLVCAQYPMRSVEPLRNIFGDSGNGVVFVDNEAAFRQAVQDEGYGEYFVDMFGGDFGHCTEKGNRLLANIIAEAIIKEVFHQ